MSRTTASCGKRYGVKRVCHIWEQPRSSHYAMARRSGEALSSIVTLVDDAADQVRSIATAAGQQSAASEEIGRTVDHINRISGETAQVMGLSAQAVEKLAGQSKNLYDLVHDMQHQETAHALDAR